jgi:formiminotetrahydrofolate cyclodeaminase
MKLTQLPLADLLHAFRSSEPTPGGGSAAALSSALGASLLVMVAGLPKPNAAVNEELDRLAHAGRRCAALAIELQDLIDADSAAYDLVVDAFRRPKGTAEEKAARAAAIQAALVAATEAPLEVMRKSADALWNAPTVAALGNQNAASDVRVAIGLLKAGLQGARHNVDINLAGLKDGDYVARVRDEARRLSESA